ncbi:MAG: NAD(P)-dependent oxidoreductase [Candidatus Nanoarchaeia archaeon]|nr:NAD(P)-dependent oxidoreductase [Candidatus Nanoarchaeia archaeon]
MMNLITGGNGQVGYYLIKQLLEKGEKIRVFDLSDSNLSSFKGKIEFVKGDITKQEDVKGVTKGVDKIYHTAGVVDPSAKYEFLYNIHVNGTKNILNDALESTKTHKIKHIINFGSASIYKCNGAPSNESCDIKFNNTYEHTKYLQEQAGYEFYEKHKLPVTTVRLAMIYGPWGKHSKIDLIKLVAFAKQYNSPCIPLVKGGKFMVHAVHVEDVAGAVIHLSELDETIGDLYNISDNTPLKIRDLATYLGGLLSYRKPVVSIPKPLAALGAKLYEFSCKMSKQKPLFKISDLSYICNNFCFDNNKLLSTGYKLKWPDFLEGMKDVVEYYEKNKLIN